MRRSWIAAAAGTALLSLAPFAAVTATAQPSTRTVPATVRTVVRPVTSHDHAAAGYRQKTIRGAGPVDCSHASPSVAAVDNDIIECSPTAAQAIACWRAARAHHVLCLDDARVDVLVKYRTSGRIAHTRAYRTRGPLNLQLADGAYCVARRGGAANSLQQHPGWVPFYYCTHGKTVWAPEMSHGFGVDRSHPAWTVHVASETGDKKVHTVSVVRAYLVGTRS